MLTRSPAPAASCPIMSSHMGDKSRSPCGIRDCSSARCGEYAQIGRPQAKKRRHHKQEVVALGGIRGGRFAWLVKTWQSWLAADDLHRVHPSYRSACFRGWWQGHAGDQDHVVWTGALPSLDTNVNAQCSESVLSMQRVRDWASVGTSIFVSATEHSSNDFSNTIEAIEH